MVKSYFEALFKITDGIGKNLCLLFHFIRFF
jgi:hypothetical protein